MNPSDSGRTCGQCGQPIPPSGRRGEPQRFCSLRCRVAAWRQAQKTVTAETVTAPETVTAETVTAPETVTTVSPERVTAESVTAPESVTPSVTGAPVTLCNPVVEPPQTASETASGDSETDRALSEPRSEPPRSDTAVRSEERYDTGYILDNLFRASRRLKLNAGEFEVLAALVRHDCPDPRNGGQRKGEVWPSPSNGLHKLTGRPRQTLQRHLASLERKGAITCLTPERSKGGRRQIHHWRPNYQAMGWKFPERKLPQIVAVSEGKLPQSVAGIWESDSESRNPPPPDPPPSSRPAGSTAAPPVWEEEEFSFLSPDERTCLQSLQVSPALWQRVRQSEPATLQRALQHVITHREEILAAPPHSLECRLGGLLKGTYIPSSEPEALVREEETPAWYYLCRACGVMHQGEHQCSSPGGREPLGERDRWLQEMKERAERAQCSYAS